MPGKWFCTLLLACLLCLSTAICFAYEKQPPLRLAILPLAAPAAADSELTSLLDEALEGELHVPLNATLQAVEYIPPAEINAAMAELHYTVNDLQKPQQLRALAEKLQADLTVGLVVKDLYEYQFYSFWDHVLILRSSVALQLVGYSRAEDKVLDFSARASYWDEYTPAGTIPELAKEALYNVLKKAALKKYIFPLSKAATAVSAKEN